MKKALSLLKYALLAVCVITLILVFTMDNGSGVDAILIWAYILLGIAIAAAVLLPLINLAQNPKGAMRSLLGLGVMVVVLGISYAVSSSEPIVTPVATFDNPTILKWTDTGLYLGYIALFGAIIVAILGEIRNSFK